MKGFISHQVPQGVVPGKEDHSRDCGVCPPHWAPLQSHLRLSSLEEKK